MLDIFGGDLHPLLPYQNSNGPPLKVAEHSFRAVSGSSHHGAGFKSDKKKLGSQNVFCLFLSAFETWSSNHVVEIRPELCKGCLRVLTKESM